MSYDDVSCYNKRSDLHIYQQQPNSDDVIDT